MKEIRKCSTFNESQELTEAISWQAIVPGIRKRCAHPNGNATKFIRHEDFIRQGGTLLKKNYFITFFRFVFILLRCNVSMAFF